MRILVLAALPAEADAVLPGRGDAMSDPPWPPHRLATFAGHDLVIATCGIGKVNTALAAGLLSARYGADLFAMTGTAGALRSLPGNCFVLDRAVQHDYGARRPDAFVRYDPGAWPMGLAVVTPFMALPTPDIGLPAATIVSGDAFIEDHGHAGHLVAALGADLVDMETAALAQVARRLGLPWLGIKATTDGADTDSAADFTANLSDASKRAGRALERLIEKL